LTNDRIETPWRRLPIQLYNHCDLEAGREKVKDNNGTGNQLRVKITGAIAGWDRGAKKMKAINRQPRNSAAA
jgi:hypothetical protein